ncbi:hypothetical protein I5M27_05520 [Adhaeribacter sp. BT258]|uniref:Uncharacterized protein n=1 Tax=Adhaeribacter terrigena TaxID=2793070 RepID=A0ABS1BZC2_9BACT|nr:hypothetical protein [Adhaeribacter terrigena]MBK0402434.1 hypothetical protein [Adhaeribacter terrigena]
MVIHHLEWALIFFGLAALVGLYMLSRVFKKKPRQNSAMLLHGLFAGFAIGILFYFSAQETNSEIPYASIFFFIVAIFGGAFMATWDKIMNREMPRYFPLLHASAAVTGIVLLILFVIKHN